MEDEDEKRSEEKEQVVDETEDETLKYHLLGPSLTKAGQDAVDQRKVSSGDIRHSFLLIVLSWLIDGFKNENEKVSEIIYNASKGSKFFNHEQVRDQVLTTKIEQLLKRKEKLEKLDLSAEVRKADECLAKLEASRDLSQYVVHVDCDAFFAAVEELDRPELKTVPMAVGKGVLTTCNYEARKFGCRSGMASFVAKKLCPQLVSLSPNYDKYGAKAKEIQAIMAVYDPLFESASIDEAYLNITAFCVENQMGPEEAIQRMRAEVLEKTLVSVSAGIGPNAKVAKIASNRNKPNGQFRIPNDKDAVIEFMKDLPMRKINGIGRVFERELDSIGIKTAGDVYDQRGILNRLFGEKASQFLFQCYLGLGRTKIQPAEDSERKSVSTEATFHEIGDKQELRAKLWWAAQELEKDLARTEFKGRTLVLKVKLHSFEVLTRQTAPPRAVSVAKDLYGFALPMLAKLEKDIPELKLRLLGLRCTNLVSTKKVGIEFFGAASRPKPATESSSNATITNSTEHNIDTDEVFEQSARQERQQELDDLEQLSQEIGDSRISHDSATAAAVAAAESSEPQVQYWDCPICSRPQPADDKIFNDHVDFCLSRDTIKETVQGVSQEAEVPSSSSSSTSKTRKRKTTPSQSSSSDRRQKRLFFT